MKFLETTALETNWNIIGFSFPTKDGLITEYRLMEEWEIFSFVGDMFIPVAEERGQQ